MGRRFAMKTPRGWVRLCLFGAWVLLVGGSHTAAREAASEPGSASPKQAVMDRILHEGVEVTFSAGPEGPREILEGEFATLRFTVKDVTTGSPLATLRPSVWLDMEKPTGPGASGAALGCKEKIGLYLQGSMSYRPDIDLNSYFILSMNNDATISVTDPIVSFTGITQLYTMIPLKRPGEDWVTSRDEKRLFVSMPRANQVAVVNTETFKVAKEIEAGPIPFRTVLQPDGRYVWVGNNAQEKDRGGVTVIDPDKLEAIAHIPTGDGHHEIAFTDDSRYAFVTNEKDGTLSVIDVRRLQKVRDMETGPGPIAVAYSGLSRAAYVANALDGTVVVVDGETHGVTHRIRLSPGIRTLRFAPGGRWGFVANSQENLVQVFDASDNRVRHAVPVGKEPHQIAFTKAFAYVRSKGTELVTLIPLTGIEKEGSLAVVKVPIGQSPPGTSPFHATADAVVPTPETGHALIANPADKMIYYYMEGMNYAMGGFRSYGGHVQRAVRVVDRSLREGTPGTYSSQVRIPAAGEYQVAFLLDSPRIVHCFRFSAKPNPALAKKESKVPVLEFLAKEASAPVGEAWRLQFRLLQPSRNEPIVGVRDLTVQAVLPPGTWNDRRMAVDKGDGIYEVVFTLPQEGVYYVTFSSPSLKVDARSLPYKVFRATGKKAAE